MRAVLRIIALGALLIVPSLAFAQAPACGSISSCPPANIPLGPTDYTVVIQGGVTKRTPAISFLNSLFATSTTTNTIGVGAKTFVISNGGTFVLGMYVMAASSASPGNYIVGQVTNISGNTITIASTDIGGSGTFSSWNLFVSGPPGPQGTLGSALRAIPSGTTDTASTSDNTIVWYSSSTSPKSESIYGCTAAAKGNFLTIADGIGTAATYPITITPASGTIANASTFVESVNKYSGTFQCDGGSPGNWVPE